MRSRTARGRLLATLAMLIGTGAGFVLAEAPDLDRPARVEAEAGEPAAGGEPRAPEGQDRATGRRLARPRITREQAWMLVGARFRSRLSGVAVPAVAPAQVASRSGSDYGFGAGGAFNGLGFSSAGQASPFVYNPGTANRSWHRFRGENTDHVGFVGQIGSDIFSGWTGIGVHDGFLWPGWGVNLGFPAPERVVGGLYAPGFGVLGSGGFHGQEIAPLLEDLEGGFYVPGFGVIGIEDLDELEELAIPVGDGIYVPGLGVIRRFR